MTNPQTRVERAGLAQLPGAVPSPPGGDGSPAVGSVGLSAAGSQTPGARDGGPRVPGQTEVSPSTGEGVGPALRTWTVELDPLPLPSANHRRHRQQTTRLVRLIREHAGWKARAAHLPKLGRVRIIVELRFPDARKRDPGNWSAPAAKAAIDGLVDAGVLDDDDASRVVGPDMRLGPVERNWPKDVRRPGLSRGRMVLHITELPEVTRG